MKRIISTILAGALIIGCTENRGKAPQADAGSTALPTTKPAVAAKSTTQPKVVETAVKKAEPKKTTAVETVKVAPVVTVPEEEIAARVNGQVITMKQLQAPLIEAYGLDILFSLVQLEMVKQEAAKAGVVVSPEEIRQENERTLDRMFKEANQKAQDKIDAAIEKKQFAEAEELKAAMKKGNEQMLDQFLVQQRITRPQWNLLMENNTYIQKIVEPLVEKQITDESLRAAFNIMYGETVKVRHIQCTNIQEVAVAKRRLANGESFEAVARELSRNMRTRALGGELPAFSRETPGLPKAFKDVAFSLKNAGDVSDPVEADGAYHIIQMVEHIPPRAVKFENCKDEVRVELRERAITERMKEFRDRLRPIALERLEIVEPVLKQQYMQRLAKRDAEIREREQISHEMEKQRGLLIPPTTRATTQATTQETGH